MKEWFLPSGVCLFHPWNRCIWAREIRNLTNNDVFQSISPNFLQVFFSIYSIFCQRPSELSLNPALSVVQPKQCGFLFCRNIKSGNATDRFCYWATKWRLETYISDGFRKGQEKQLRSSSILFCILNQPNLFLALTIRPMAKIVINGVSWLKRGENTRTAIESRQILIVSQTVWSR